LPGKIILPENTMNPRSSALDAIEIKPLSEVRKNLRINWYRCPIERSRLIELSQRSNLKGFFQAFGHIGLLIITGTISWYFFVQQQWLGFFPALFLHGTFASFLTAPHHELCHGSVFRTHWLNEAFLRVYSLLGWQNFPVYKFSHSYHHRFTLHPEGDREEVMPVTPSLRILYLVQLFTFNIFGGYQSKGIIPAIKNSITLAMDKFDNPFNSWGSELYVDHKKERREARNWARKLLLFHGLVVFGSIASGHWILAVLISGSVFIANWYRYFVGVPMHCGLRSNVPDFRKSVRTITLDPFTEFLYWHMNWHLEHHMYAAVPCYNLKSLYAEIASDMPQPRTLVGAWKEMRETWKRQLNDPGYTFDTPIPSSSSGVEGDSNDLAVSMGTLAPESIAEELSQKTK
jgi:fatty acid desaturase